MRKTLAALTLFVACLGANADEARQKIQVSKTLTADFPAGGTLLLANSVGDVTIEGWDQPGVEITTTKSSLDDVDSKDMAKEKAYLDRVNVTAAPQGSELVVTTEYPRHREFPYVTKLDKNINFYLEYRIKVPRSAKLIIRHDVGEVHITDVTGNIQASATQGLIALNLSGDIPRSIDAKSDWGSITADRFAAKNDGHERNRPFPFGHKYVETAAGAAQSLNLRIGFGDILILKEHEPRASPVT